MNNYFWEIMKLKITHLKKYVFDSFHNEESLQFVEVWSFNFAISLKHRSKTYLEFILKKDISDICILPHQLISIKI